MPKLILLRHGQSEWNKANIFTGWVDIPLSKEGIEEALKAGGYIAELPIDVIFSSSLIRAQMTAMLSMSVHKGGKIPCIHHPHEGILEKWAEVYDEEVKKSCIPVYNAWQLNERMYGRLQGLDKQKTIKKFGAEQVLLWRRSYDTSPPDGESLAMTAARTLPYFKDKVMPFLLAGKNVLIVAHGNSLRAIVMYLEELSKDEIIKLEIATGVPLIYECTAGKWEKL